LQVYHTGHYPLAILAKNPSLGRLTHLLLQPRKSFPGELAVIERDHVRAMVRSPNLPGLAHLRVRMSDVGDVIVDDLIGSGLLGRLRSLDLRYGLLTDGGAERLARHPATGRLESLDVSDNGLTERGVEALRATGVKLTAHGQSVGGTDFYENDME
jgi:hypothetical protein